MADADGPAYYAAVRRAGGAFLLIVAAFLAVVDVFTSDYAVDNIALGLLLSTGIGLLGLDSIARRIGDRDDP